MNLLHAKFRPEFLNRVDDIVLFKPLTLNEIEKIVELQVNELRQRLTEQKITLELTDAAKQFVARKGYDPVYGARPMKRVIQREIETPIARMLLAAEKNEGVVIKVEFKKDKLSIGIVNSIKQM